MTKSIQFTITKKIAKHGSQSIIVVPKILEQQLKPGTIIQLNIKVIDEGSPINASQEQGGKNDS